MDLLLQEAGVTVQTQDAAKEIKSDAKSLNDNLPPNWKKATSSNGKVYYFNKLTRETRWERPVENSTTIVISEKSSASISGSNYVATNTSATSMSSIGPGESLPKSTSLDSCHSLPPPPEDGIASNSHSRRSSINHESNRQTSELSIANTRRKSVAPMIPTLVEAEKLPPPSVSPVAADPTPLLTTTDKTTETQSTPSEPVASVSEKVDDTQDLQSPPTLSVLNEKVEASNPETESPTSNNTSNSPKKISSIINSLQSEVSKSEDQIREEKKAQRLSTNIAARISEFSTIAETSRPSTGGSPSATPRPLSGVFKMAQENVVNTANSPAQLNVPVSSARPRGPSVSMNKFNSPSATPDPQGSRSDNATPKNRSRGASVARTSSPLNPGGDFISELASKLQMPTPPQMSRSGSNATTIPESSDSSSIKRSGSGYSEDSANANGDPSVFTVEFSDDTILCFPSLDPSRVRLHGNLSLKSPDNSPKKNFVKWTPCYAILYNATFLLMKENPFKNKKAKGFGIVDLVNASIEVATRNVTKKSNAFVISFSENTVDLILMAENDASMKEWIRQTRSDINARGDSELREFYMGFVRGRAPPTAKEVSSSKPPKENSKEASSTSSPKPTKEPPKEKEGGFSFFGRKKTTKEKPDTKKKPSSKPSDPNADIETKLNEFLENRPDIDKLHEAGIIPQDLIFGGKLELQYTRTKAVPNIIQVCTGIVEAKGQEVEGIYRLSGNNSNIQRMRVMFNQGEEGQIDWSGQSLTDINVVTGLLKLYFRELEVSLIPTTFYEPLLQIAKTPGATSADKVPKMAKVLKPLPEAHKVVLKFLLQHLKLVSTWAEKTKMDVGNLAIVFAPTLLKPPVEKIELVMMNTQYLNSIMEEMINSWDKLF